jgi:hypothetical protein
MEWKKMTGLDIAFTLLTGFLVAIFAIPYIAQHWIGLPMTSPQEACGVTFIGGTLWNSIMPLVLRKVKAALGSEEPAP